MRRATVWTAGILGGMGLAGALAGYVWVGRFAFGTTQLAALLFVAIAASSLLAVQLHRRGMRHALLVGAAAGGGSVLAFMLVPFLLWAGPGVDPLAAGMLLLALPLVSAGSSACGTLLLARGVDEYRRKHGMMHAPR